MSTLTDVYQTGQRAGAKAERERIAQRQQDADECPPRYPETTCAKAAYECKRCWVDWLEADE